MGQLDPPYGGVDCVDPGTEPDYGMFMRVDALTPGVGQHPHFLGELIIVGRYHASLAADGHVLDRVERKGACVPDRAHPLPEMQCTMRLACILDHEDIFL